MSYIKKNFLLILIFILAIFLRLNYDLLIKGYNFDELAIMSVAKQAFPFEIIKTMAKIDYHAPLYYFIAHPFTYLENEWHYLRFLNLIFALLNVFTFYKIGTLLKDRKFGYTLALFISVSHIQITTVSLIKFYCLCFLLFSIVIYYFIKVIKKNTGYYKLGFANLFFILSSTLGFIPVIIEYLVLSVIKKNKKTIKSALIAFFGFILYLPILINQYLLNKEAIISPHASYSEFSFLAFYNFINDYFSPLVNYSCNLTPIEACSYLLLFIKSLKETSLDYFSLIVFIFLSFIPVILALIFIGKAILKSKTIKFLNYLNVIYFLIFATLIKLEITGFIPLYIYPCGLILIISALYGIYSIENKKIKIAVLTYLILSQLLISNYYPKEKRTYERIKEYYCIEKYIKSNSDKDTIYLFTNGARFLKKYYKNENIIDFDTEKLKGSNGRSFIKLFFGDKIAKANKRNIYALIKDDILKNKKSDNFEKYFKNTIQKSISQNEEIILAFFAQESPILYTQDEIINILTKYEYRPELSKMSYKNAFEEDERLSASIFSDIILSHNLGYLLDLMDKNFKRIKIEQYKRTPNDDYVKVFETNKFKKTSKWIAQNTINSWIFITYKKSN